MATHWKYRTTTGRLERVGVAWATPGPGVPWGEVPPNSESMILLYIEYRFVGGSMKSTYKVSVCQMAAFLSGVPYCWDFCAVADTDRIAICLPGRNRNGISHFRLPNVDLEWLKGTRSKSLLCNEKSYLHWQVCFHTFLVSITSTITLGSATESYLVTG